MYVYKALAGDASEMRPFAADKPLTIDTTCTATDFCLYYTSPAIKFK